MIRSFLLALAAIILTIGATAPTASASFLWFGEHKYLHRGRYYAHREWVPANRGFAGFYRYSDPLPPGQ